MIKNNINQLVGKNLCFQCGTCKSICPNGAIKMKRVEKKGLIYPKIDIDKCVNCGLCLKVCPINNIDYKEEHIPGMQDLIGIYSSSNNERFKYTSSGGVVTEIIDYLFSKEKINKAIVAGMDNNIPTNSKVYVIEDNKNLCKVSGSVYQPVPVNEALEHIDIKDKIAFVGLPCHMRGLELFLKLKPKFEGNFIIKLGLICTIGRSKHGTTITLNKTLKIDDFKDIEQFRYRCGNYPGQTAVKFKDKGMRSIECVKFLQNTDYIFIPKGCLFCTDLFNDKADITVGDAWGLVKEKKSMVISRNEFARGLLNEMVDRGALVFDERLKVTECLKTQHHCVRYKIYNYSKRLSAYKSVGASVPNIKNLPLESNSFKEYIGYNLLLFNSVFFNTHIGLKLVKTLPSRIIFKYRNIIMNINTKI